MLSRSVRGPGSPHEVAMSRPDPPAAPVGRSGSLPVLIIDGDAMVRQWIRNSLDGTEFRLVGEARSAKMLLDLSSGAYPNSSSSIVAWPTPAGRTPSALSGAAALRPPRS